MWNVRTLVVEAVDEALVTPTKNLVEEDKTSKEEDFREDTLYGWSFGTGRGQKQQTEPIPKKATIIVTTAVGAFQF